MSTLDIVQWMIEEGHAFINLDGTFRLSEDCRQMIQKIIDDNPAVYAQIFPDRLH